MDAIRTDVLSKHYSVGFWRPRPYVALDALTLQVEHGEVFGFLGPNGAGKTTTLKLLMQLIFPTSGSAQILGRDVGDIAVRRRIGYLPENPSFYDNVSAEELLTYFASLFGYRGRERTQRVARLLDEVGIGAARRLQLRKYSKGMIQRVGLAQALLNDPEVVFLDEPMSGLDPMGRREVRDIILRLRDRGTTVFFSSHILADAEALCSRVAIVAGGRLAALGRVAELVPFRVRGWEMVVSDVSSAVAATLSEQGATATSISTDRYHVLFPSVTSPDATIARITAAGGRLVSLNPIRDTLEDFFMAQVAQQPGRDPRMNARATGLVALHVFRDSVRDKVLYSIVAFAVILMFASYVIGQLTAGQDVKIIKDLGLAAMSLFGTFMAVFIGIGLVAREIDRRSIHALLVKPVRRHEFIVGKYLGLVGTLLVNLAVMTVAFYAVLVYIAYTLSPATLKASPTPVIDPRLLVAVGMIACELGLVTAVALFCSTFSSSALLSAGLTAGLYVAGQFGADLKNLDQVVASPAAAALGRGLYYVLPNFAAFDVKASVVHGLPIAGVSLVLTVGYGVAYICFLLLASVIIFARRDFK